jgi:hypothetical protein
MKKPIVKQDLLLILLCLCFFFPHCTDHAENPPDILLAISDLLEEAGSGLRARYDPGKLKLPHNYVDTSMQVKHDVLDYFLEIE